MRIIKVQQGQTVLDIALITLGSALGGFLIALENGISITDVLVPGQELNIPDQLLNKSLVKDFAKTGIKPATGLTPEAMIHYAVTNYVVPNYWI